MLRGLSGTVPNSVLFPVGRYSRSGQNRLESVTELSCETAGVKVSLLSHTWKAFIATQ